MASVLIAGGYGLVGGYIARHIRAAHPGVELILAGRRPEKGEVLARELGHARTAYLDVAQGVGGVDLSTVDLVVASLQDPTDALLHAAIARGVAHIEITKLANELAPTVYAALHGVPRRPVVLQSQWQAGVMTFATLEGARGFRRVESVATTGLFDPQDPIGDMVAAEIDHFVGRALLREQGVWKWVEAREHPRRVTLEGGAEAEGLPMAVLDVPGIAAATGADNVRFDFAQGTSSGTRAGGPASHDLYIDIEGLLDSGTRARRRLLVIGPKGQAHLTALGVFLSVERILGLDGQPPAAGGLYSPETLVAPAAAMARAAEFGVRVITSEETLA